MQAMFGLVHSAAGGVGSALVQLGKLAGVRVIGVIGSAHKREACLAMGADAVIVKSEQDLWSEAERFAPKGFDAIFDANGVSTLGVKVTSISRRWENSCIYGFASMLPNNGRLNWFKLGLGLAPHAAIQPIENDPGKSQRSRREFKFSVRARQHAEGRHAVVARTFCGTVRLNPLPVEIFDSR